MRIKILFDKKSNKGRLNVGWGISFLIDEISLFDTGEKGEWLIENMKNLRVNISKITNIIISHDHWDHTGGLWNLLELNNKVNLYITPGFSEDFKAKTKSFGVNLKECRNICNVNDYIFTTGELITSYKGYKLSEQSLVIKEDEKISVLTGCSHPGIINILKRVKEYFKNDRFHLVMGGFHLMNKDRIEIEEIAYNLKGLNVEYIGATHCTGEEAEQIIKEKFGERFIEVKVGDTIKI